MKQNQDIKFVRIRGRIVPIKKKDSDPSGVKKIVAGASIAGLSGLIGGKIVKSLDEASELANISRMGLGPEEARNILTTSSRATKAINRAKRLSKFAIRGSRIGGAIGGILAGRGIDKLLDKVGVDKESFFGEVISNTTAFGIAVAESPIRKVFKNAPPSAFKFLTNEKLTKRSLNILKLLARIK